MRSVVGGPLAISVLLHVVIAVALLFFTPLREVVFARSEPDFQRSTESMSGREIADVAELIEKAQAEQQKLMVKELLAVEEMIEQQRQEKLDSFEQFEQVQLEETPDRLIESLEAAAEAMAAARESLEADEVEDAMVHQVRAEEAHETIRDRLQMASARQALVDRQAEVLEAQRAAADAAAMMRDAEFDQSRAESRVEREQREVANRAKDVDEQVAAELPALTSEEAQKKADEADAEAKQARSEAMKLDAAGKRVKSDLSEARKAAEKAKKEAETARKKQEDVEAKEKELAAARQEVSRLQGEESKATSAVAAAWHKVNAAEARTREMRLAREKADLQEAQKELEEAARQKATSQQESLEKQLEAIEKQEALAQALRDEVQRLAEEAAAGADADDQPPRQRPDLENRPFAELYEEARAAERRIIEAYKEVKAMDLAVIRDVSLEAAKRTVDVPQPDRPELNRGRIEAQARTGEQLEAKKAEMAKGLTETAEMVQLANLLLSGSERQLLEGGMSLEQILAMRQQQLAMNQMAEQTVEGEATDFTQQSGQAKQTQVEASGGTGQAGQGEAPNVHLSQDTVDPPPEVTVKDAVPGRAVAAGGTPAGWVYVSDWWLLGPFDNTGRANIDRSFPPEALPQNPNLSAAYPGKTGRTLRWYFHSANHPAVVPPNEEPYGIWYAWTELEFDEPRDIWVALGSDDKGRLWLNGQLVWVDKTDAHKGWKPGYKLVKLPFKAGRNAVLYRVENGQMGMAFSMMLYLGPDEQ